VSVSGHTRLVADMWVRRVSAPFNLWTPDRSRGFRGCATESASLTQLSPADLLAVEPATPLDSILAGLPIKLGRRPCPSPESRRAQTRESRAEWGKMGSSDFDGCFPSMPPSVNRNHAIAGGSMVALRGSTPGFEACIVVVGWRRTS
jgi:hypothetical protein